MQFITFIQSFIATREQRGAGLADYALLLVLIAVACVLAITTLGQTISDVFNTITGELN